MISPVVSVLMPVFNEEGYVKDTIDSVLHQHFTDYEFIIINDGSQDGTQDILNDYAQKDARIKLITNPSNLGFARSLNRGLETANGQYIAMMDAGDVSYPERLEKQVKLLEENRDISIVGANAYLIAEDKRIIRRWEVPAKVTVNNLYRGSEVIHPSIMVHMDLFRSIGPYNDRLRMCVDFEFYARALQHGFSIANIPEFLVGTMHRESRLKVERLQTIQIARAQIKLTYLPHFFSVLNILYTLKSLVGCLLPPLLLKKLGERWMKGQRC
jgi:glycosyltransferase involved in cell wall biosynthesis